MKLNEYRTDKTFTITRINSGYSGYEYAEDTTDFIYAEQIGKIIDDSREDIE